MKAEGIPADQPIVDSFQFCAFGAYGVKGSSSSTEQDTVQITRGEEDSIRGMRFSQFRQCFCQVLEAEVLS